MVEPAGAGADHNVTAKSIVHINVVLIAHPTGFRAFTVTLNASFTLPVSGTMISNVFVASPTGAPCAETNGERVKNPI